MSWLAIDLQLMSLKKPMLSTSGEESSVLTLLPSHRFSILAGVSFIEVEMQISYKLRTCHVPTALLCMKLFCPHESY